MSIVAIQGGQGSYHDQVARAYFGVSYEPMYCRTFAEVFEAVEQAAAAAGVVASGNTIFGVIDVVHDLLRDREDAIAVVDETGMAIHHCLIGQPGAQLADIMRVHSQDVALAQCTRFLHANLPNATLVAEPDTAGSVQRIKASGDPMAAAIASRAAAELYDMQILHENVEDNPGNYTSFLVIRKK